MGLTHILPPMEIIGFCWFFPFIIVLKVQQKNNNRVDIYGFVANIGIKWGIVGKQPKPLDAERVRDNVSRRIQQ